MYIYIYILYIRLLINVSNVSIFPDQTYMEQGSFSILFKKIVGPPEVERLRWRFVDLGGVQIWRHGSSSKCSISHLHRQLLAAWTMLGPLDGKDWKSHGRGTPVLLDLLR